MSSMSASAILASLIPITPTDATAPMAALGLQGGAANTAFSRLFEAEATAANTIQNALAALPSEELTFAAPVATESAPEALMLAQLVLTQSSVETVDPLPEIHLDESGALVETEAPETTVSASESEVEVDAEAVVPAAKPMSSPSANAIETSAVVKAEAPVVSRSIAAPTTEKTDESKSENHASAQTVLVASDELPVEAMDVSSVDALPADDVSVTAETTVKASEKYSAPVSKEAAAKTSNDTVLTDRLADNLQHNIPLELHQILQGIKPVEHAFQAPELPQHVDEALAAIDTEDLTAESADIAATSQLQAAAQMSAAMHAQAPANLSAPHQDAPATTETLDESERPLEAITSNEKKGEQKPSYEKLVAETSAPAMGDDAVAEQAAVDTADAAEAFTLPLPSAVQISETSGDDIRLVSDRGSSPSKTQAADTQAVREIAPKNAPEIQSAKPFANPIAAREAVAASSEAAEETAPKNSEKSAPVSKNHTELQAKPHDEKSVEDRSTKTLERQPAQHPLKEHATTVAGTRQSSLEGFSYSARRDEISASAAPVPFFDGGRSETVAASNPTTSSDSALPARTEKLLRETLASIPNPFRVTTFEIKPEGFGPVRVKISARGEGENAIWKVQIQTSDPAARSLLSEHLNELRERMPAAENVKVELAAQGTSEARSESNRQEQGSNRERNEGRAHREEAQRQSEKQKRGGSFLEWLAERE